MRKYQSKPVGKTKLVHETPTKGVWSDSEGRLYDAAGLAALASHGYAIFKVVKKVEIQRGPK